jgi:hypothetical protein
MPLHRLKRPFKCEGFKMDRGSMARWLEDAAPHSMRRSSLRRGDA